MLHFVRISIAAAPEGATALCWDGRPEGGEGKGEYGIGKGWGTFSAIFSKCPHA